MSECYIGPDNQKRCSWCSATEQYIHYHDHEWGFPVVSDQHLFEKLSLESFQSGLSWLTILKKRENFRRAFAEFDFNRIAQYTEEDVARLLQDTGIIRHRGKIEAVINNAKCAQALVEEAGSLSAFFWSFDGITEQPKQPEIRSTSPASVALAKVLKKKGWKFVGPTTVYAFMQSMGFVNDHAPECFIREQAEQARQQILAE